MMSMIFYAKDIFIFPKSAVFTSDVTSYIILGMSKFIFKSLKFPPEIKF